MIPYELHFVAKQMRRWAWMIEVPLTRVERLRTYLPWSWNSNHATKWVLDPNAPKTIRVIRMAP